MKINNLILFRELYLRVSTEKQFLENQREEITRFAEKNGMSIDKWYTDRKSVV